MNSNTKLNACIRFERVTLSEHQHYLYLCYVICSVNAMLHQNSTTPKFVYVLRVHNMSLCHCSNNSHLWHALHHDEYFNFNYKNIILKFSNCKAFSAEYFKKNLISTLLLKMCIHLFQIWQISNISHQTTFMLF